MSSARRRDPDAARAVLRRAVELGVDHIDTAQFYGPDVVNDLIREALHPYPDNLRLVTKVGARRDDAGAWLPAQSPQELRQGVEDNLRSLRVERIDLVNLRLHHEQDGERVPLAEQLGMLQDLRREGKLDLIGLSNATLDDLQAALELVEDLGEVQNAFSILDRTDEATVEFCAEHGVAYVPFFPLGSAFTGGPATLAAGPGDRAGGRQAWRDPVAGCAGLAARPLRARAPHPRHELGRSSRGEHERGQRPPRRGRPRHPGRGHGGRQPARVGAAGAPASGGYLRLSSRVEV